jgi:hypothetical protein
MHHINPDQDGFVVCVPAHRHDQISELDCETEFGMECACAVA